MSRQRFIVSLVLCCAAAMPSFAAESVKGRTKGPITVTSESLSADNKAHTATFEKNVVARTTDMTIYADTMVVHYKEDGGKVTKIEAAGRVR